MRTRAEVKDAFTPVPKVTQHQQTLIMETTNSFTSLADDVFQNIPEGADRTYALRKLLDAKQAAIQGITHSQYGVKIEPKKEITNDKTQGNQANQQTAQTGTQVQN